MAPRKKARKKAKRKTAPAFAKTLKSLIETRLEKSQRWVAEKAVKVDPAAVNRLCTTGAGSEEIICKILKYMRLKRRRILEILADRRAELCDGEAREVWKNFRYAFPNTREYMTELCPFPLDMAYACSYASISLQSLLELAKKANIEHIEDVNELKAWQITGLFRALADQYGTDRASAIFSRKVAKDTPRVLYLDVFQQRNAAEYVPLRKCHGDLLFGIPHVVLAYYVFEPAGEIKRHPHAGGVEFLYSKAGTFELTYRGAPYPQHLSNDGAVVALDGAVNHSIRLIAGEEGRLLVVRYDPRRRSLLPGPTLLERARRKEARRRRKANTGGGQAQTS